VTFSFFRIIIKHEVTRTGDIIHRQFQQLYIWAELADTTICNCSLFSFLCQRYGVSFCLSTDYVAHRHPSSFQITGVPC